MSVFISSNYRPLPLLSWADLPESEREHRDAPPEEEHYDPRYVKAYGEYWNLHEFQRIEKRSQTTLVPMGWSFPTDDDSPLLKWHGICSTSMFGGLVVRHIEDDDETVQVGWVKIS